jgi:hypothetical protein
MLVLLLLTFLTQELRTNDDRAVKSAIDARTRIIYDETSSAEVARAALISAGDGLAAIASDRMRDNSASYTEATGLFAKSGRARLFSSVWRPEGKYSAEYYVENGELLFVFDSLEFLPGRAPAGAWTNVRGLSACERRTYFRSKRIAIREFTGAGAPVADATLIQQASWLERELRSRISHIGPYSRRVAGPVRSRRESRAAVYNRPIP